MLFTFIVELGLAIFVIWRYRPTRFGKVVGIAPGAAGNVPARGVQDLHSERRQCIDLAEDRICRHHVLPLTGLYLVSLVSHKTHFLKMGYATAIGFVIYFLAVPKAITGAICGGN